MTHTCTKVTVRQRAIRNNRISLYLDYYPAARSAEREGFEPPEPRSSTVFKTAAIDHSATSPKNFLFGKCFFLKAMQRYKSFLILQTYFLFFHELIVFLHP